MGVPTWIKVYLGITTGMAAVFSLLAYMNPGVQFATWGALTQPEATSLAGPLGLYIARNLATVTVGVFALMSKQPFALAALCLIRLATDGLDTVHNLAGGNPPGAAFAAVMFAVECVAMLQLTKSLALPAPAR